MKPTAVFGVAVAGLLLMSLNALAADSWQSFTTENTPELPGNEIQFLGVAQGGGIWIGTLTGAARIRDDVFTPVKGADGKALKDQVWTVRETPTGLWVGTKKGLVDRDGKFVEVFKGFTVVPIIESGPGHLWALGKTRRGAATLFQHRDSAWEPVEALAGRRVSNIYRTTDGRLWLTLDGDGVLETDPATGIDQAVHHLEGFNVTALMQDSKGLVWCGLWANGVASWDGTQWTRSLPRAKESAVLTIVEDGKAGLWAATSANGLWRRPSGASEWTGDLTDQGAINVLVATRDGRVWISGQNLPGLRYWSGSEWIVSLDSPLPIRTLVEAPDGTLWAGGILDGVHVLKP